ncbi:MAG: hypothetical protein AAF533_24720 [Acidobacteriota bacterium]
MTPADRDLLRDVVPPRPSEPGPCPTADDLVAHARGETPERSALLDRHLESCAPCVLAFETIRDDIASADALPTAASLRRVVTTSLGQWLRELSEFELPEAPLVAARGAGDDDALEEALSHYRDGRLSPAIELFRRATSEDEADGSAPYFLGTCLVERRDLLEGVDWLREATRREPRLAEYRWQLAQALLLLEQGEDARDELRRCARLPGARRDAAREMLARLESRLDI